MTSVQINNNQETRQSSRSTQKEGTLGTRVVSWLDQNKYPLGKFGTAAVVIALIALTILGSQYLHFNHALSFQSMISMDIGVSAVSVGIGAVGYYCLHQKSLGRSIE